MKNPHTEIAKFDSWVEAEIFRGRLKAKGIPAVLSGPNTSGTLGMYMGLASKVSVLVPVSMAPLVEKTLWEGDSVAAIPGGEGSCRSFTPFTPIRLPLWRRQKNTSPTPAPRDPQ
jgi:hypothetical protein